MLCLFRYFFLFWQENEYIPFLMKWRLFLIFFFVKLSWIGSNSYSKFCIVFHTVCVLYIIHLFTWMSFELLIKSISNSEMNGNKIMKFSFYTHSYVCLKVDKTGVAQLRCYRGGPQLTIMASTIYYMMWMLDIALSYFYI